VQDHLDGMVMAMANDRVDLAIAAGAVSAWIAIKGDVAHNAGTPVRVTFYRGEVIQLQGDRIRIDTEAAPATSHENLRNAGLFSVIGGRILAAANLAIGALCRRTG
jgi:hypothetical protein